MTFGSRTLLIVCAATCLLVAGCPDKDKTSAQPVDSDPAASAPAASGPASAAATSILDTPDEGGSCLKPFKTAGDPKELEIAGKKYHLAGDVLSLKSADGDETYTLGHLTDVKEDTPENLGNVQLLIKWLHKERADALVVTGDLGESQPSIENVMRALAEFKGPVFVMIGNREGITDFEQAFDAVSPALPNLFNMNRVRLFNADDVSLVSLPGYFNPAYIHSQDGCRYTADDVHALEAVLKEATATVVIASHGPPRQDSITGIDRIHEGVNVGDPALSRFIGEKRMHFGLFGNIHEAGGKATDLGGKEEIRPDTFVDELFLNPGPADSVRWPLLDGTESNGMGGLLTIKGKKGKFKIRRIRAGEAKPAKAAAPASAPAPQPEAPATP